MSWLIRLVSKKGDTVLDPFAGSFTTGVACKMLNRNFIGIEQNEEYCQIGRARIGEDFISELPRQEIKVEEKKVEEIKVIKKNVCDCGGQIKKVDGGRMCELCFKEYL